MQNLIITRPVRSKRITQKFGDNKACIYPNGKVVGKSSNSVCPPGAEDFYKSINMKGHNGHDIATWRGEAVVHAAMFDGWMKIEKDWMGGIGVDVISNKPIKLKDGRETHVKIRYWHLMTPIGYDGKPVTYGQIVGLCDNTGASSGDHLHWAPKFCDKDGKGTDITNGYYGAFDQEPYYNHDVFAGDSVVYIGGVAPLLSPKEKQEMNSQLGILRLLLLSMRELLAKL